MSFQGKTLASLRGCGRLVRCPRCNAKKMITDVVNGEILCSGCGCVVEDRTQDANPAVCMTVDGVKGDLSTAGSLTRLSLPNMGLSTLVGQESRDANGFRISSSLRPTILRMRTWDRRVTLDQGNEGSLKRAFEELGALAAKLNVGRVVVEKAAYIYRKAVRLRLTRGRSVSEIVAASLYAACRETETQRTLDDVAAVGSVKRKELARTYRLLFRLVEFDVPPPDPRKWVTRIGSRAGISERTCRYALEILAEAGNVGETGGRHPRALAAAALYIACLLGNEAKTQDEIALAAEVTTMTVRNRLKGLELFRDSAQSKT